MVRTFYANGKLLLTGEYLVLDGAAALVLPLKVGQHMKVAATGYDSNTIIHWHANILKEPWFSAEIGLPDWSIVKTSHDEVAKRLIKLLQEAGKLNHMLFTPNTGFDIFTETGFNESWGFGSSAALVANIAQWAIVDPFELHFRTSNGSGADIAAAISAGPVLYRLKAGKPLHCRVDFHPAFFNHLWLIYTGHKQNTSLSIQQFRTKAQVTQISIDNIDKITLEIIQTESLKDFMRLLNEHESIISKILEIPPIRKSQFPDFKGEIKSLGAWGGDFILAASEQDEIYIRDYFKLKNMHAVFSFDQIIL